MNPDFFSRRLFQQLLAPVALLLSTALAPSTASGTTVSMGTTHGCSVADTGQATCWGDLPLQDQAPYVVKDIKVGRDFSCALVLSAVRCWGNNEFSQLGTAAVKPTGQFVDGLDQADQIAVGARHACALLYGSLRCWGDASQGQLGEPARATAARATPIPGIAKAVHVAAGNGATCAVQEDGRVLCVGAGSGLAGAADAPRTPRAVPGISDALEVSLFDGHACVLRRQGRVACWGSNRFGELGIAASSGAQTTPVEITHLGAAAKAVAAGNGYSCALLVNETIQCWGNNASGQLGTALGGAATGLVTGITDATAISAGQTAACAALQGGYVQCWGQGTGWSNGTCGVLGGIYPEHPASYGPVADIAMCRPLGSFAPMAVKGLGPANDAVQVLDWAEKTLPQTFPPLGAKGPAHIDAFYLREYPGGHKLAVNGQGTPHLLYLGPLTAGQLADLGPLGRWLDEASREEGLQSGLLAHGSAGINYMPTFGGRCENFRLVSAIHGTVNSLPEGLATTGMRAEGTGWSIDQPISGRTRLVVLTNGESWPPAHAFQAGQPIPPGMKAEPVLYSEAQACPPPALHPEGTVDLTVFYSLGNRKGQLRTRAKVGAAY